MDPFVGEIRLFSFPRAPDGWFLCNGITYKTSEYPALAALLGNIYGGDGATTFGVPNLCGRLAVGQGLGTGRTNRVLGTHGGAEAVALAEATVPAHSHTFQATSAADSSGTLTAAVLFGGDKTNTEKHYLNPIPSSGIVWKDFSPALIEAAGGSLAHANVMPSLGLSYCIAWQGIFPQQPS